MEEREDIIAICPKHALEGLKENKRFWAKVVALNNVNYRRAMKVEDYNKGRTIADVSDKLWHHGKRSHLRPDTMYADERYVNITQ